MWGSRRRGKMGRTGGKQKKGKWVKRECGMITDNPELKTVEALASLPPGADCLEIMFPAKTLHPLYNLLSVVKPNHPHVNNVWLTQPAYQIFNMLSTNAPSFVSS